VRNMMNDGGNNDDNGEIHDDDVMFVQGHDWDAYHFDEAIRNCLSH
jgi:hypothetical protein